MYVGRLNPQSNRSTFSAQFEVVDDDTDEDIDLTGLSITFELRACGGPLDYSRQSPSFPDNTSLVATTANGKITLVSDGIFQVVFSADEMKTLSAPRTYEIGVTVADGTGWIEQYIIGTLPVLNGVVTR